MPDLSPLPRLSSPPAVGLDLERLAAARRTGHGRRVRRTAATTAGACAVAGVTALLPAAGHQASLVPTRPAPAATTETFDDRPRAVEVPAGGGDTPVARRAPRAGVAGVAPAPRDGTSGGAPEDPLPTPSLPPVTRTPVTTSPVDSDSTITLVANDGTTCDAATSRPWCVRTKGAATVAAGTSTGAAFEMCFTGSGTGQLHFEDGAHVDVAIWRGGDEVWRHSSSATHGHYDVPAGKCASWQVTWSAVGNDGTALAAGSYRLTWVTNGGWEHEAALPNAQDGLAQLNRDYRHEYDLTVT
ncbi:MAG TPA: hypothetical protein VNA20_04785 [Frankiaceae bacterium]|nr:hypothetical protein [Frankiaceae bacterium]